MISHQHKAIFVHIPKCAGSSVEKLLAPERSRDAQVDYEHLYGWCPKRKIHLQHATAQQMLEMELVTESQWRDYFKFAIVRNPFARTCSDYYWMLGKITKPASFWEYIERRGRFTPVLADPESRDYRGDHLDPQRDFLCLDGKIAVDFVGRFENLNADVGTVLEKLSIPDTRVPHLEKGRKRYQHYSHFYNNRMRERVASLYAQDLDAFDYQFEDKRTLATSLAQYVQPLRHRLGNWKYTAQTKLGVG